MSVQRRYFMEYKKSRWELKYETFKSGSIDNDLKTLNDKKVKLANDMIQAYKDGKIDDVKKMQEEMKNITDNLEKKDNSKKAMTSNRAKIENTLQLKKDLVQDSAELLKKLNEIKAYEDAKKLIEDSDKDVANLEAEIKGIDAQIKQLNAKINAPNVKPEDKKKFEQDKEKLKVQRQQKSADIGKHNSDEYSKALKSKEELEGKIAKYDVKSINTVLAQNEKLIAKCDLIGANLVNGKSMEEINVSLKKFSFTPDKDFAKKVETMRAVYQKDESEKNDNLTKTEEDATKEADKALEAEKLAKEKAESAIKAAEEAEKEYEKISNLPSTQLPWYKKIPGVKQVVNFVSKIFNKEGKTDAEKTEEAKVAVEKAKAEAEKAKKELEEAMKAAKEAQKKAKEARKAKSEIGTEGRSTDYLEELRQQKDENDVLQGIAVYGDTFRNELKYQAPNVKSSLAQDEVDKAKSKKDYVMENYQDPNNPKKVYNDHRKDKRAYNILARKNEVRKNIADMKALKAKKSLNDRFGPGFDQHDNPPVVIDKDSSEEVKRTVREALYGDIDRDD